MKPNFNDIFVASQMPSHQANNNPLFVSLMQYYFKFLGQQQQSFSVAKNLRESRTIDGTLDDFLKFFSSEFISKLPHNVASDKRQLMRRAIDLYQTKGTKQSVEAFFRLVYDQDVTVSLPRDNMLTASGSRWVQYSSFRVTPTIGNSDFFSDGLRTVYWSNSSGSFNVKIDKAENTTDSIIECFFFAQNKFVLNRGDVLTGYGSDGSIAFRATATVTTNKIQILSPGKNFKVGQIFTIAGNVSNTLYRVIDVGSNGELQRIQFLNYGYGMAESDTISINPYSSTPIQDEVDISVSGSTTTIVIRDNLKLISDSGIVNSPIPYGTTDSYFASDYLVSSSGANSFFGKTLANFNYAPTTTTNIRTKSSVSPAEYYASTATIRTSASVVNVYPGQYEEIKGHISESSVKLQDSYFYQIYSYLINSQIPLGDYKKSFGDLMHPAGKIFFGNLNLDSDIDIKSAIRLYLNEIYSIDVEDSVGISDSSAKTFTGNKTDSVASSDVYSFAVVKSLSDSSISSDTIGKYFSRTSTDSLTSSDVSSNSFTKGLAESLLASDTKVAQNTYVNATYFSSDYVMTPTGDDTTITKY